MMIMIKQKAYYYIMTIKIRFKLLLKKLLKMIKDL